MLMFPSPPQDSAAKTALMLNGMLHIFRVW
jgi:hypothetical protein